MLGREESEATEQTPQSQTNKVKPNTYVFMEYPEWKVEGEEFLQHHPRALVTHHESSVGLAE